MVDTISVRVGDVTPFTLGGREFYLHDGSATTLHDAILAHGGEAQSARDAYDLFDATAQEDLVAFLKSL